MTTIDYASLIPGRSDEQREAEAVGIPSDIRYCACGCGEPLKPDAKHRYIRGHRLRNVSEGTPKDTNSSVKLDDASVLPFPGKELPKEIREDLEGKLEFFLALIAIGWETRDPYCGGEFSQRTGLIAEKLVPIIAKSPELLKWFTTAGNASAWMDLFMALWPILAMVGKHHLFHSVGQPEASNEAPEGIQYDYPVE